MRRRYEFVAIASATPVARDPGLGPGDQRCPGLPQRYHVVWIQGRATARTGITTTRREAADRKGVTRRHPGTDRRRGPIPEARCLATVLDVIELGRAMGATYIHQVRFHPRLKARIVEVVLQQRRIPVPALPRCPKVDSDSIYPAHRRRRRHLR